MKARAYPSKVPKCKDANSCERKSWTKNTVKGIHCWRGCFSRVTTQKLILLWSKWARLHPRMEEEIETDQSVIWLVLAWGLGDVKDVRLRSLAPWRVTTDKCDKVKMKPKLQWRFEDDGERGHSHKIYTKEFCACGVESASPGKAFVCYRQRNLKRRAI